jgi:hypothetical protein
MKRILMSNVGGAGFSILVAVAAFFLCAWLNVSMELRVAGCVIGWFAAMVALCALTIQHTANTPPCGGAVPPELRSAGGAV